MDFNNGLYVFNGVPGLEASKGERIAKGLQNLQTKIKHLEQVRNSERETSNSGSTDKEDITLSDVRLKLLFLQLQYSRAVIRTTREKGAESNAVESEHRHDNCEIPNCCKETQTGTSLYEFMPTTMPKLVSTQTVRNKRTFSASQQTEPVKEASTLTTSNSGANSRDQLTSESIPPSKVVPIHCSLNIDLPFILGASVFEGHNLVANVQSLMAKMKTHTKALCGSRFQASRNFHQDTKRMMREISKDMTKIEIKQAQFIEELDNRNTSCLIGNQVRDTSHHESEVNQKQAKKLLNTDSTRTSAAVSSKENRQLKSIRTTRKTKHAVPTNKIHVYSAHIARQRLLRSIKECKKQLSEEDISWDLS